MVESTTWVAGKNIQCQESLCNFAVTESEAVKLLSHEDKDKAADWNPLVLHRLLLRFLHRLQ